MSDTPESDAPRVQAIVDAIQAITAETGKPAAPKHIVARTGLERENVQSGLALALEWGLVEKPSYGKYVVARQAHLRGMVAEPPPEWHLLPKGRAGLPMHSVIPLLSIEVGGKIHTQAELVIRSTGDEARVKVGPQ